MGMIRQAGKDEQEMSYMKPSATDAETPRQYSSYPLPSGQFPQQSHPEYHALLSRGQGDDARLNNVDGPIETSRYSTETGNFRGNSNPSRPYMNDISENRHMPGLFPVENSDARMVPQAYAGAPVYGQTTTPYDANAPRIVATGTYQYTNLNPWTGPPLNTRPVIIRGDVQNRRQIWKKVGLTFLVIILLIALLLAAFVKVMNEKRIKDDIVRALSS